MTKQEVLEAYSDVSEYWKEKLKTKYPEYFQETVLEEGKIYTFENVIFQYYNTETIHLYNLELEYLFENKHLLTSKDKYCKLVEDESIIEQFLIAEAKRRGFKVGVKVDRSEMKTYPDTIVIKNLIAEYSKSLDAFQLGGKIIYEQGVWGKIIQE